MNLGVLSATIQNALSRAYPNPLPSNQVLTVTTDGAAAVDLGSTATLTVVDPADFVWGDWDLGTAWVWDLTGELFATP